GAPIQTIEGSASVSSDLGTAIDSLRNHQSAAAGAAQSRQSPVSSSNCSAAKSPIRPLARAGTAISLGAGALDCASSPFPASASSGNASTASFSSDAPGLGAVIEARTAYGSLCALPIPTQPAPARAN